MEPYDSPPSEQPSGGGRGTSTSRGIPPPWAGGPPPFPGGGFPWNGGYNSGGQFGNNYANFGMGWNYGNYGYAAPYGAPDYPSMYPNYEAPAASSGSGGKLRKSMFALVGRLTVGVMSSVIFGFPVGF